MSLAEIEAELEKLSAQELRRLALKSWRTFLEKEARSDPAIGCGEDDPRLLAALDDAIAKAGATLGQGYSGEEVRARLSEWTSR